VDRSGGDINAFLHDFQTFISADANPAIYRASNRLRSTEIAEFDFKSGVLRKGHSKRIFPYANEREFRPFSQFQGALSSLGGESGSFRAFGGGSCALLSGTGRIAGSPNQITILFERSPEDEGLDAKGNQLERTYSDQQPSERSEPPIYLQFIIGASSAIALSWYGTAAFFARRFFVGGALLSAAFVFGCCAFSAVGFGSWRGFWRLLGL
jgi:hypothetical protein